MYFSWYGQACFKLQSGERIVICDPFGPKRVGLRRPQLKADIFILPNIEDVSLLKEEGGEGFIISSSGEYEVKGIFIYGIKTPQKKPIFLINLEDIKIGYLGEINLPLEPEEIKNLGEPDVLILPVGNKKTVLSPTKAVELVEQIEPAIIIPCCYCLEGIKTELEPLDKFSKELGVKEIEKLDKFRLKKNEISKEKMRLVVLNPI